MKIELRNGAVVDVPDPREAYQRRMDEDARRGRWLFHFEDGVPVSARWYQRIDKSAGSALLEDEGDAK